jgi:hypothetical protein
MKLNFALLIAAAIATLTACGGGGDGATSAPTSEQNSLAAYVGDWQGVCNNHSRDQVTVKSVSSNALTLTVSENYYDLANCTGSIVAIVKEGADFSAIFNGTVDTTVQLSPAAPATNLKIDRISLSAPERSRQVTGTAVTTKVVNGISQWCFNYTGGSTCVVNDGTTPAGSASGAFYKDATKFYTLTASGQTFVVEQSYTRKP